MAPQEVKNIAIFAHYDKQNIVDDYVLIYLTNLKKFCDKIIFVSDGDLSDQECQKLAFIVSDIIAKKHGEYDFGSWKKGFNLVKEKYHQEFLSADKLIFANDSCYCIGGFDFVFGKVDKMPEIDCFGITDSIEVSYHLQSYFLIFRKSVFLESFFNDFLQNVRSQSSKDDIITIYEIGLSQLLAKNNKKLHAIFGKDFIQNYANQNKKLIKRKLFKVIGLYQKLFGLKRIFYTIFKISNCYSYHNAFYLLILSGCPLLKRAICFKAYLPKNFFSTSSLCYFWKGFIKAETQFDSNVIVSHSKRTFR